VLLLRIAGESPARDEKVEIEGDGDGRLLLCAACSRPIGRTGAIFVPPGATAARNVFSNPGGRVFEVLALREAPGAVVVGAPTTDATWFSGYAWSHALCGRCSAHLGWRFGATSGSEPPAFFGLVTGALREA
jgi:cereblon